MRPQNIVDLASEKDLRRKHKFSIFEFITPVGEIVVLCKICGIYVHSKTIYILVIICSTSSETTVLHLQLKANPHHPIISKTFVSCWGHGIQTSMYLGSAPVCCKTSMISL